MKPCLVAFYDIQPGNGAGLFSKEKIRNEISKEKVKKKGSGKSIRYKQANNIYIGPKSKIESRAHYAPGGARTGDLVQVSKLVRQEAQLSPMDRAMRRVNRNLANCHATVQKLLIRQVLTKSMV